MRSRQAVRACLIVVDSVVLTSQAFAADSATSFRFTLVLNGV